MNRNLIVRCRVIVAAALAGSTCLILSACEKSPSAAGPSQPAARTPNKAPTGTGAEAPPDDAVVHIRPEQQNGGAGFPAPTGPRSVGIGRDRATNSSSPSGSTPPGSTPPGSTPPASSPPSEASSTEAQFAGLVAPKPATWQYRAPAATSTMRRAEYSVPGVEGSDQAQIIVYQFPGGGSFESNVDRWKTQFKHEDGSPIEAKVQEVDASGIKVAVAEVSGDYRGMGMSEHAKDHILIAAMIEGEGDPIFIQFVGPSKTVETNRDAYMTMLRGIKRNEPMK